jgi:hypothetical protein
MPAEQRGLSSSRLTASRALRPGRYPYCSGSRSASKIGSKTSTVAIRATRSLMQGIPGYHNHRSKNVR